MLSVLELPAAAASSTDVLLMAARSLSAASLPSCGSGVPVFSWSLPTAWLQSRGRCCRAFSKAIIKSMHNVVMPWPRPSLASIEFCGWAGPFLWNAEFNPLLQLNLVSQVRQTGLRHVHRFACSVRKASQHRAQTSPSNSKYQCCRLGVGKAILRRWNVSTKTLA